MSIDNRVAIQHYHTITSTTVPSADVLKHGEIAIMATKDNEKLIIKNSNNSTVTFSSDNDIKKKYVPVSGDTTIEGDLVIKGSIISTKGFYEDPNGNETGITVNEYATTVYVDNQIESLDSVVTAQNGYYISGITQTNGKITSVGTAKLPSAGEMGTLTAVTVTAGNGLTNGGTISGTNGAVTLNVGAGTGIAVAADSVSINSDYQNKINQGVSALTKINAFLQNAEMTGEAVDTLVEIQKYIDADSGATAHLLTRIEDANMYADSAYMLAENASWAAESAQATADGKQSKLVSGTNIKTVNGESILGSGNISVGTYSKPSAGIPKTDLASDVQTSLGKADNALPKDGKAASATIADSFSQHTVTNLNNIVKGKFFQSSNGADNLPEDTTSAYLTGFSLATNNDDNYQVAFGLDYSGNAYTRAEWAGKWNPWKRLAYTDQIPVIPSSLPANGGHATTADSATTATKATQDGSGNVITSTYATKSELNGKMDKVTLATVATTGNYNDLNNKPTIPSTVTESTVIGWGFTKNAGTITDVKLNGVSKVTNGVADLSNVTTKEQLEEVSDIVNDLNDDVAALYNNKVDKVGGKQLSTEDYTAAEKNKLSGIAAGAEVNVQSDWNETNTSSDAFIKNKPTIPTIPSSLPASDVYAWAKAPSKPTYTKSEIGLGNVDNTADANKSVKHAVSADTATRATYASCDGEGLGIKDTYVKKVDNTDQKVKAEASSSKIYLLGHTSSATTTSEAYKNANVYSQNGNVYATAFYQTSDERMKTFGDEIEVDFDKLSKLRKSKFVFNDDNNKTHIGVSAQEVKEIYPEMVDEDENGYLKVDYSKLSVVALKAVDKLYEEMTEIKALIKELINK